jgi:2-(1,2-epoxy-1,2-dihydrophenyl)acetyl-CoA isomerase
MTARTVLVERDDAVMTITLNRPAALNALNATMYAELGIALMAAAQPDVRAVVLGGAGRGFCAGADLKDAASDDPAADLRLVDGTVRALLALEKPVVGALHGAVAGGGIAYALACDIRIAGDDVRFVPAFIDLGLVPDLGCSWLIVEAIGRAAAFEWLCSGRRLEATEALGRGLLHEVVASAELSSRASQRARELAARPTRAIGQTKRLLQRAARAQFEQQLEHEAAAQELLGRTEDYREALAAFRERRAPRFTGR